MSTPSEDGDQPVRERPRERSVSEVARAAFESRLMEGDRPPGPRKRLFKPDGA